MVNMELISLKILLPIDLGSLINRRPWRLRIRIIIYIEFSLHVCKENLYTNVFLIGQEEFLYTTT